MVLPWLLSPPQTPPLSGIGPSKSREAAHYASTEVRKLKCGGGDWDESELATRPK